jgi:hypothetical protein
VIGVVFAAAPLYLAMAGLVVLGEGEDGCPGAAAVSARLIQLVGEESGAEPPDALVVDGEPGALRVRLLSSEGSLREQKTLDLAGSCDELADAVATVAVAWRSQLKSDDVPPPVLPARVRQVHDTPRVAAPAPPRVQPDLELAYGVQTVAGAERWAPGLVVEVQTPLRHDYSFTFSLQVPAPRAADVDLKTWRWMELGLVVGASHRSTLETLYLDAQLGLGAGVNVTTSQSLSAPDSYRLAPPSLVTGMRWTYRHSASHPWFGLTFAAQPASADSPIKNAQITTELWRLGLALGATLTFDQLR